MLAAVGCNSGRQLQTDLYQRELRLQEDEIYRLEDCLEEYQAIVRDYRCELAEMKVSGETVPVTRPRPAVEPLPEPAEPTGPDMLPDVPEPLDLGPPATTDDLAPDGAGLDPSSLDEAPTFDGAAEAPPFEGAQLGTDDTASSIANTGEPLRESVLVPTSANRSVGPGAVVVPPNPYPHATASVPPATPSIPLSETIALGVRNGPDQTLVVRIAERSSAWFSGFNGQASVMLTDPSIEGKLRRVARWDFSANEVRDAMAANFGPGRPAELVLTIALPAATPTDQPLRLWVRLVDGNGNKTLQATMVRFGRDPLRLATTVEVASAPRRLPAIHRLQPPPVRAEPIVPTLVENVPTGDTWRPAGVTRHRRVDPAIETVSFEAPAN